MEKVTYEHSGELGIITFADKPLNLLGAELGQGFFKAIDQAKQDSLRGLILKVDEGHFSAGADINRFLGMTPDKAREGFRDFQAALHAIEAFPFPTMAVVRGLCLGGGLEIALAFDLIWAAETLPSARSKSSSAPCLSVAVASGSPPEPAPTGPKSWSSAAASFRQRISKDGISSTGFFRKRSSTPRLWLSCRTWQTMARPLP